MDDGNRSSRKRHRGLGDMDDGNRSSSGSSRKRHRGLGDDVRPWSDITPDVLYNVLRRLTVRDFVRFGAVCASWRWAMLQRQHCRPMLEPPWVIPFWYGGTRWVVCPPERRIRGAPSMPWEMMRSSDYLGSSNGWLGLQRKESVHVIHALSGTILRLPDLTTIPGVKKDGTGRWPELVYPLPGVGGGYFGRYALKPNGSSPFFDSIFIMPPPDGGDRGQLAVFAICSGMKRLLFARSGDIAWSLVDMPAPVDNFIMGLTGHRSSVYAVDVTGCVAAWDYCCRSSFIGRPAQFHADALASGPQFTRILISSGPDYSDPGHIIGARYLVEEANGDLLQVELEVEAVPSAFEMLDVRVFRLAQHGVGEGRVGWRRLQHLGHGGTAIFVDRCYSAAFTCSDFPWLQRNCIYFRKRVYNLRIRKMQVLPSYDTWFHDVWLVPTL